jgi:hypothetical protein
MNTRSLFLGLWGSHTLSLCDCGGNCSSMRSQLYHRPHVFFTEFGQFPFTKITLFLHMSICAEPDQCSKKYFPDHFSQGPAQSICLAGQARPPSTKWSICSSRLRTQLKIRTVKGYVLGRLGPSCKSVYVLIDLPQDPAFQFHLIGYFERCGGEL